MTDLSVEEIGSLSWDDLFLANEAMWSALLSREIVIRDLERRLADAEAQLQEMTA